MKLLIALIALILPNYAVATDSKADRPWQIIRKEDLATQEEAQQTNNDFSELFALMHPESQLRRICLAKKDYHCKEMAKLLYCAKKSKKPAHKAYCERAFITGIDFSKTYHPSNLAEKHSLSPQQTTKEIEWFLESFEELSK